MGYYGRVPKRPYRPSPGFVATLWGFFALSVIFVTLPHAAVSLGTIEVALPPFPVSVDPHTKTISEPTGPLSISTDMLVASAFQGLRDSSAALAAAIMSTDAYDVLPLPEPVPVRIERGMRLEQVAQILDKKLAWSDEQRGIFLEETKGKEGMLYPSLYLFSHDATPYEVAAQIATRFDERVRVRYASSTEALVPIEDALTIASIIEREAGNKEEMAVISGILWNRLFSNMRLQADSTLQYVRGTSKNGWWPVPRSRDKYLKSPYNTYQHEGLPPGPIASPSVAAIYAALNPEKTDCMFFFHSKGRFYCSETYEEHVAALKKIYGRGR